MGVFLATMLALAAAGMSSAQAPIGIREVARLVEMRSQGEAKYPVFEYEAVFVSGDVLLQDYKDATGIVRQQLRAGEQIIGVIASQQLPLERRYGKDLMVQTCIGPCGKGTEVRTADGKLLIVPGGNSGRYFVFERVQSKLQLDVVINWIE